jgi:hypothetical protein
MEVIQAKSTTPTISFSNIFNAKAILKYANIEEIKDVEEHYTLAFFDVLDNGFYLNIFYSRWGSYFGIFNPLLKKMEKEKYFESEYFVQAVRSKNVLLIKRESDGFDYVVMDTNLKVLRKKELKVWELIGCDDSFIYFYTDLSSWSVDIYDWKLKKIQNFMPQDDDSYKPFFLERHTNFMNIRFLSNKYIIDTRITNWEQLRIVYIFDNFGNLINKISIEYDLFDDKDIVHYASSSIIVFSNKEKKLKYFDLYGDQFQETQILNFVPLCGYPYLEIKSDSNQNIYFYDKSKKVLYISE